MTDIQQFNRRFILHSRPHTLPSDDNFKIERVPIPEPGPGKLLIKIILVALSPWQNQRMKDFKNYTKPFEIGELIDCDVLGQVVGGTAEGFPIGQLVTGRLGWQEFSIATPNELTPVSNEFSETLWLTALSSPGLTAYCAMDLFGRPMPGQTLVVTSAAGAVGSFVVQLGKLAGMRVIGITGAKEKSIKVTQKLGADACVEHNDPFFADKLSDLCPSGVNLFFDTLGGSTADTVFDNLAKYAQVLIVGRTISNNSDRPDLDPVNMRQLWAKEAKIQCFSRYSYPDKWEFARQCMMTLCRDNKIVTIDHIVDGFDKTPSSLRDMLTGNCTGKVLVRYGEQSKK